MKKILLSIAIALFTLVSFNQTFAAATPHSKPYVSQTRQTMAWPTDVLVENYSGLPVTVRFITIVSDGTVRVDPYPAVRYYAQLLHQDIAYQTRVLIWDYSGRLFYDRDVGSVARVTLNPPVKGGKMSVKDVVVHGK